MDLVEDAVDRLLQRARVAGRRLRSRRFFRGGATGATVLGEIGLDDGLEVGDDRLDLRRLGRRRLAAERRQARPRKRGDLGVAEILLRVELEDPAHVLAGGLPGLPVLRLFSLGPLLGAAPAPSNLLRLPTPPPHRTPM